MEILYLADVCQNVFLDIMLSMVHVYVFKNVQVGLLIILQGSALLIALHQPLPIVSQINVQNYALILNLEKVEFVWVCVLTPIMVIL